MPIYPNFYQTLSACPIVELRGYAAACGLKGRLYAYLDFAGPTGTARDGLAEGMLALAIEKKKLISGQLSIANLFPDGERGHTVPSDPFLKAVPLPFSSNGMKTVRPDGYDDQMPHRDNVPDHANFRIS